MRLERLQSVSFVIALNLPKICSSAVRIFGNLLVLAQGSNLHGDVFINF